jgi:hypothetical protein
MNKIFKSLFSVAVTAAFFSSQMQAHTGKTYLQTRSHGVNIAMENSAGWHEVIHRVDKDKFGGNFQAIGFYQDSVSDSDIGKYFGVKNKNLFTLGSNGNNNDKVTAQDIDFRSMIHIPGGFGANEQELLKVKIEPSQRSYGVYLNYYQDLEKILKGLYFNIDLPIVHVENDVNLNLTKGSSNWAEHAIEMAKQYFKGEYSNTETGNNQEKLTHALVNNKNSATGIADIDLMLGYQFLDKDAYHASINLGLTIPTGNDADGKKAFEAICGNGQHFGFGGGLDFCARVWGDLDHNIKLNAALNYRYLFGASEKRTLKIKDYPFSQYAGLVSLADTATKIIPAANVTTLNVDVTPGSQFDGILNLAYNNGGFHFDVGYNLYFREAESVRLKDKWDETKYGIALQNAQLGGAFNIENIGGPDNVIKKTNLDTAAAETPSQTTHKIYSGLAYIFKKWETPLILGMGAHYEFSSSNSALQTWGLNGKVGISF